MQIVKNPVSINTNIARLIIAIVFPMTIPMISIGQSDSTQTVQIETNDGNRYVGEILYEDIEKLILKTAILDTVTIKKKYIVKRIVISPTNHKTNEQWFENPQATRYFWQPNGYGVRKKEAYYQNVWVLFNQFTYGVSDRVSIGGGVVPLFLFGGAATPLWFTAKVSLPVKENVFNVGAGGLFATVAGEDNSNFGILYGIGTLGSRDANISLGIGYGYASSELATIPTLTLSGLVRITQKTYFLTENYMIPIEGEPLYLLSFGGRSIVRRAGLDYGLFAPTGIGLNARVFIPWLGITVPLTK